MEWQDQGLILGVRRHGEGSVIVELMTEAHGRHMGLVRGGRSSRMRALLQPGNSVEAVWRARLDEHLGTLQLEATQLRAARLMENPVCIYGLQTMAGHLRLLPERDPQKPLYEAALIMLEHMDKPEIAAPLMIRFELALLEELGFGLDLKQCAATGSTRDLVWVSPKSGKAVSREAGMPWADKLLALPSFLGGDRVLPPSAMPVEELASGGSLIEGEILDGIALVGFFLDRHVYGPRGIKPPDERDGFVRAVLKSLGSASGKPS